MSIDFDVALVLVLATAVAGLIWAIDSVFFARARRAGVNDFVPLPLDEGELYEVVERHLAQPLERGRVERT